jgi:UDP-glucose 4-epimerase
MEIGLRLNMQSRIFIMFMDLGEISSGKYATLIGLFTQLKFKNKNLTVVLPGTQRRNFTHVEDIINGLILVGENGYGDDFGIGSSESFTVMEIAKMFGGNIKILS